MTEDIISAIEFNKTGDFLAAGDRGGRVVMFERVDKSKGSTAGKRHHSVEFRFHTEFQSHDQEFDYLRSLEIDEKINVIKWLYPQSNAQFLLTTNDKTIKMWKVYERKAKTMSTIDTAPPKIAPRIKIPRLQTTKTVVAAAPRRVYNNAHAYHINSLSLAQDGTTFLSADDLRLNLWDIETSSTTFNAVDIRPPNLDNLVEVITAAEFHPQMSSSFCYGTSKGVIRLCDMRSRALCDYGTKTFAEVDRAAKNFYQEISSSVSDLHFSQDGKYIFARDYLTLKVWDVAMDSRPLHTIAIHDQLRSHLNQLFEDDVIFDRFECAVSPTGGHVLTGSYNNNFHIYDRMGRSGICIEASRERAARKRGVKTPRATGAKARNSRSQGLVGNIDTERKILHLGWHPQEKIIAIATLTNLFIYAGMGPQQARTPHM